MKRPRFITREEAIAIYATWNATRSLPQTAGTHNRSISACMKAMAREGLRAIGKKAPPISDELVKAMHAEYTSGLSFSAVGKKYGKERRHVQEIFASRGLPMRAQRNANKLRINGAFAPVVPLAPTEIDELIACESKLRVPPRLKQEWRSWTLERRGEFIARLRAKLASPDDRPNLPFSSNVIPFDYTTREAREICTRLNAGRDSRSARVKIDICSQGVIWRGKLWFWSAKAGYQKGPWTPEGGRPVLHHVMWEEFNGRAVPPSHVVRFADGNPNNFTRENLVLQTRNNVARENQAAALKRKARERTSLLLARTQKKTTDEKYSIIKDLTASKAKPRRTSCRP